MPPKVQKPTAIRALGDVDVAALVELVRRISPATWDGEDAIKENNFDVFHHTQHIIFRFIAGNRDPEDNYANPAWEIWRPVLMPIMLQAVEPYQFRNPHFPKAMLAKLAAGHHIDPHYDGAGSNQRVHKIHVPLVTNPDASFQVNGESFHLDLGKAFEVNNIVSHGARNDGDQDRVHFIFEVYEGDYQNDVPDTKPDGPTHAGL